MISRGGALAGYAAIGAGLAGSLGIDTSPIVAGLSVTGLTVGFASRDVASNYIAGLMLIGKSACVRTRTRTQCLSWAKTVLCKQTCRQRTSDVVATHTTVTPIVPALSLSSRKVTKPFKSGERINIGKVSDNVGGLVVKVRQPRAPHFSPPFPPPHAH